MNKKGLIGKIFAVIGIIILIILIIAGVTAYQVYGLVMLAQEEQKTMETNIAELQKGDCSKITEIESSITRIKSKATSACINPIIKIAVEKMEQIPIKCNQISALDEQVQTSLAPVKAACANQTKITNSA